MDKLAECAKLVSESDDFFIEDISDRIERGIRGRLMIFNLGKRKRDRMRVKIIHLCVLG
jgi:hypothetical protein